MVEREATTPRPVCLSNTRQKRPNQRRRVVYDDKQCQAVGQLARVQRINAREPTQKGGTNGEIGPCIPNGGEYGSGVETLAELSRLACRRVEVT